MLAFLLSPTTLTGWQQFLLLLPLCLSLSIVYKTTRSENLAEVPVAALKNWVTVVVGMLMVGAALLLVHIWAIHQ